MGPTKADKLVIGRPVYIISNHFTAISSLTDVPYPNRTWAASWTSLYLYKMYAWSGFGTYLANGLSSAL